MLMVLLHLNGYKRICGRFVEMAFIGTKGSAGTNTSPFLKGGLRGISSDRLGTASPYQLLHIPVPCQPISHNMRYSRRRMYPGALQKSPLAPFTKGGNSMCWSENSDLH